MSYRLGDEATFHPVIFKLNVGAFSKASTLSKKMQRGGPELTKMPQIFHRSFQYPLLFFSVWTKHPQDLEIFTWFF